MPIQVVPAPTIKKTDTITQDVKPDVLDPNAKPHEATAAVKEVTLPTPIVTPSESPVTPVVAQPVVVPEVVNKTIKEITPET